MLPRDLEEQLRELWQPAIKLFPSVCRCVGDTVLVPTRQHLFNVDNGVSVLHSLGSGRPLMPSAIGNVRGEARISRVLILQNEKLDKTE